MVKIGHIVRKVIKMKLLHQETPRIRFHCRDTLDFPQHIHDVLELVFVHRGRATAVCGSVRYELGPGDLFVAFPNQPHGYENSQDIESDVLIVPVKPYLAPWRHSITQQAPQNPVLSRDQWHGTQIPQLLELARPVRQTLSDPVLQGYAMIIVGTLLPMMELVPQPEGGSDSLHQLLLYIGAHYREPLTRSDIAKAVGYNESYISHLFSERLGTTLVDYLTSLRLKDARELLQSDMTVSQISLTLGFGSIRSFNRAFLREFGTSPGAYRRKD